MCELGSLQSDSGSTPVRETFRGETVWEGVVETFELEGHVATRCYAFPFVHNDKPEVKMVLGVPSINSPVAAVRVAIAAQAQKSS
jgi:hypothetical protein